MQGGLTLKVLIRYGSVVLSSTGKWNSSFFTPWNPLS